MPPACRQATPGWLGYFRRRCRRQAIGCIRQGLAIVHARRHRRMVQHDEYWHYRHHLSSVFLLMPSFLLRQWVFSSVSFHFWLDYWSPTLRWMFLHWIRLPIGHWNADYRFHQTEPYHVGFIHATNTSGHDSFHYWDCRRHAEIFSSHYCRPSRHYGPLGINIGCTGHGRGDFIIFRRGIGQASSSGFIAPSIFFVTGTINYWNIIMLRMDHFDQWGISPYQVSLPLLKVSSNTVCRL